MRTHNGRYTATNRLPALDTTSTAADLGKHLGGAALQAVAIVTAVRIVDAVFNMIVNKHQARRARTSE